MDYQFYNWLTSVTRKTVTVANTVLDVELDTEIILRGIKDIEFKCNLVYKDQDVVEIFKHILYVLDNLSKQFRQV